MSKEKAERFIVCGPQGVIDGELALCSKCGADIYPTSGTLKHARAENIPLICMDCFANIANIGQYRLGGVMHHGQMLEPRDSAKVYALVNEWLSTRKK